MPFKNPPPLYTTWSGMKQRCQNPKSFAWENYGGRGIRVCDRWSVFKNFETDMGDRPDGHSIDRIDNNGDYSPENCRWASQADQTMNTRRAVFVTIDGVRYRAIDLARKAGIKTDTVVQRANRGLPMDDVCSSERFFSRNTGTAGGLANGERQKAKTHCPHGHEYTEKNTITSKHGWRRCRACFSKKEAARIAQKKGKDTARCVARH